MSVIELPLNERRECDFGSTCLSCNSSQNLKEGSVRLRGSSGWQLLAIVPWLSAGTSLKSEAIFFPASLCASIIILWLTTPRVIVHIGRCAACLDYRRQKRLLTIGSLTLGTVFIILAILVHTTWTSTLMFVGNVLFFGSILGTLVAQPENDVKLLSLDEQSVRLKVRGRPDPL